MKRFTLVVVLVMAGLMLAALPVAADGSCPVGFETGGNGWCADGVAFRAWQVESGIELKWVVSGDAGTDVVIERQIAGGAGRATVVATSTAVGEYTLVDEGIEVGPSYVYQVLLEGEVVGDPIEAGVAATATDPGGGASPSYRLYIPLTLALD